MENEQMVKDALSYVLGSDLHEVWRASRKLKDGRYEPRIKKSEDESWNASHGTDQVDIANHSFEELPSNWQYENLETAKAAINLVFDKVISSETITPEEIDSMASIIHDEWLKRNEWVFDSNYGDPKLAAPFEQLSKEEQDKDRAQLGPAISKVQAYLEGKIDINTICEQYGLSNIGKTK